MCTIGWIVRAAAILVFSSLAWSGPARAAEQSAQSRFLDTCLKRVDIDRDKTAAKDCYTPDFVMMGPETHATKDHAIHGAKAVAAKLAMGGGDSSAWGASNSGPWTKSSRVTRSSGTCIGKPNIRTGPMQDSMVCRLI